MSKDRYEEKYTDPDLRREIKEDIKQSDRGGKPGQWSARKSQMLVREYENQGGAYKEDKKDEAAKSLEQWSEQDWQTRAGDEKARGDDSTKRYLPKEAWDKLDEAEKEEAERTKEKASKEGKQHVEWTPAVKKAMSEVERGANQTHRQEQTKNELYEKARELDVEGRSQMNKPELSQAIEKAEER